MHHCSVILTCRVRSLEINPILVNFSGSPSFSRSPPPISYRRRPPSVSGRYAGALAGFPSTFRQVTPSVFLSWTFPFTHSYRHLKGSCSVYHSEIKVLPNCDSVTLCLWIVSPQWKWGGTGLNVYITTVFSDSDESYAAYLIPLVRVFVPWPSSLLPFVLDWLK